MNTSHKRKRVILNARRNHALALVARTIPYALPGAPSSLLGGWGTDCLWPSYLLRCFESGGRGEVES